MKRIKSNPIWWCLLAAMPCCKEPADKPLTADVHAIGLKEGPVVLCGPSGKEVGKVSFLITGSDEERKQFNFATALLHSFEYDEAEKIYAGIIAQNPRCAMAYWGVAMCNYHPLWTPPEAPELKKGTKALAIAASISQKTMREADYINALKVFYKNWDKVEYRVRCKQYEQAMEAVYKRYPADKEAAIFYALALDAAADPTDTSFSNQQKAGAILNRLYANEPDHPGIIHYIIHTYDYPSLAHLALPAARKYASIAPASAHAQHMPSHIFVRLGLWDDCIRSNKASMASAKCYAEGAGIKGHWDEELHSIDYLMYGYLQKADTPAARELWRYLSSFQSVQPVNLKGAYTFAAVPARYVLENRLWKDAAELQVTPAFFPWTKFPWQLAIVHFARVLGAVHTGQLAFAQTELDTLIYLQHDLLQAKETYKANQVAIQVAAAKGWILWKQGRTNEGLANMQQAADMEDKTEKHPVTPGEVLPARELLGDMFMELHQPQKALEAYKADLQKHPNRYNGLTGAARAAKQAGREDLYKQYQQQLNTDTGKKMAV